jgi:hypothetical protein
MKKGKGSYVFKIKITCRDPDQYEFHVMTLPPDLTMAPHSENSKDVVITTVEPGRLVQGMIQRGQKHDRELIYVY